MLEPVLLNRSDIDPCRWDVLITDSLHSVFYGFSWYLDIVSESWQALVWPSANDYQIIMPLPVKRRLSFPVIYQPHFCQYLGIFSTAVLTNEIVSIFLRSCLSHFPYISSYSFHPDLSGKIRHLLYRFPDVSFLEHRTYRKSLIQNQAYHADRKRNLKRGLEWNWICEEQTNTAALIALFQEHHAQRIEGGVRGSAYQTLEKLVSIFRQYGTVTLRYASLHGEVHAGILIFRYGRYSVYIFNAADDHGRKGNARTVMLDRYFQEHKETDFIFDFESAQKPDVRSFYQSFGGVDTVFFTMNKTSLRFPLNYVQSIRRFLIRTIRALLLILCKI